MTFSRRNVLAGMSAAAASCILPAGAAPTPSVSGSKILLGQSAAFTGPAAGLGLEMRQGVLAAIAEMNAEGGIAGRQLELISRDDGYEPNRAAENTQNLINNDKVFALVGYVGTPTTNAALPIITNAKIPLVGAFTGAASLRDPVNPFVFNVRASYMEEGPHLVKILKSMGAKKIAVFYQDDAYGQAVRKSVDEALVAQGLEASLYVTHKRNSTNVAESVEKIISNNINAVAMGSVYKPSIELVKELRDRGQKHISFASVSFVGTTKLIEEGGVLARGIAITQVMPYPKATSSQVIRDFQKAMKLVNGGELTYGSVEGYISTRVFLEGLKASGSDLSREKLINALDNMKQIDLGGFKLAYNSKNHNGSRFVEQTVVGMDLKIIR